MRFAEQIESDVSVFVNLSEFAETYQINDEEIEAVLEEATNEGKSQGGADYLNYEGLQGISAVLYVKEGSLEKPNEGQVLRIDGKIYLVEKAVTEFKMLTIYLRGELGG